MRLKIILPHVIVVLLVGLLSYFIVRQKLTTVDDPAVLKTSSERQALGAAGVLQLRLLRAERWLAEQAKQDVVIRNALVQDPFEETTRRAKTTDALDLLKRHAGEAKSVFPTAPDLACAVDKSGKAIGRSDEQQTYHGDPFGEEYKALAVSLADKGHTGSDIWISSRFSHKHFVSYAPILDPKDGKVLGALVLAWALSDQGIAELSDGASALMVMEGDAPKARAKSNESAAPGFSSDLEGPLKDSVVRTLKNGTDSYVTAGGTAVALAALRNVGDGSRAAIAVGRRAATITNPDQLVWPILAASALGIVFVLIAGFILGGYIAGPIDKMEETLLQVINGNTNSRIQIEHPELGGLAFRINQLLNTVLGVEEDTTDEEGRPSVAPGATHFNEALAVDGGGADAGAAAALASEPEAAYYARIYAEYIEAKKANSESVEGITQDVFVTRIKGMEVAAATELGRPVRYAVQRRDKQVVLLKVPLA